MSAVVAVALAASWGSAIERHRRITGRRSLEGVVLVTTAWLSVLGIVTTLLAIVGHFGAVSVSVVGGLSSGLLWPWGRSVREPSLGDPAMTRDRAALVSVMVPVLLLMLGLGLRWPVLDYPLAGRDQGTYTLRAQHALRTGALHAIDPVLEAAGEQQDARSGPADLTGLYHRDEEPWRRDRYEAAYRPGFYLSDLDRGVVRPQFLHVHPMLMATTGLVLGSSRVADVVLLYAGLSILAVLAIARRLWGRGPWALWAAALWATAPLCVWVLRTPLSEGPASLLMLSTVLAVLVARESGRRSLYFAALLMGTLAWVRGNGWLAAPVLLAAQWLVPADDRSARRAGLLLAALVGAAVLVHVWTAFPYLYDELLRQLPLPEPMTPGLLVAVALAGLTAWGVGWAALGRLDVGRRRTAQVSARAGPWLLVGLLLVEVIAYLALRVEPLASPFSRLDPVVPMVGAPILVLAAVGLGTTLRRWPTQPSPAQAWMLGLAGVLVVTVGLYAQRNLPRLGLYYYGRYLVPELMPAFLLLAVQGLRSLHGGLRSWATARRGRTAIDVAALAGGAALWWSLSGVLLRHPVTRLPEFEGAERVVAHLAERLPPDAIVIAGGEGWHHGHTFNQVGGALAFGHGLTVLPYRTREAAYASMVELLISRPQATGTPAPPVYLLLNEATKHHKREAEESGRKLHVSAIDDLLPPPFVARRVELVEMVLNRLTPVIDGPPTRVTRDGLRMALWEIEIEPARWSEVESWTVDEQEGAWRVEGPPGLSIRGGSPPCLGSSSVTVDLPAEGRAGAGPVSLVLVASPGTAAHNSRWSVKIDDQAAGFELPDATPRHRDTLGPVSLARRPRRVVLRGAKATVSGARCPRGGLAEVRLLGPERAMLRDAAGTPTTFAPRLTLGHPVRPTAWVSGRGLSRYRSGIEPVPVIQGLSMQLDPGVALRFPTAALPDGGAEQLDVVLTITGAAIGPDARVEVMIDGQPFASIDPPDAPRGSWQSPALRWTPVHAVAQFEVVLTGAAEGEYVLLRDIGLFSRAAPRPGHRAHE